MKYDFLIGCMIDRIAHEAGVDPDHMKKCMEGSEDFTVGEMTSISQVLELSSEDFDKAFFDKGGED